MDPQLARLQPTPVFDTYWRFAAARQAIYLKRLAGDAAPWTDDSILGRHRFTNAYRASDRVSQYLIRRVIYREDLPSSPAEVFFRTVLFKLFNRIDTWEFFEREVGAVTLETCGACRLDELLTAALADHRRIYSAAYIMPGDPRGGPKHRFHLRLLFQMLSDRLPDRLTAILSFRCAFETLRNYGGIGDFLAYQLATDLNYSPLMDFPESDLAVPGPGAIDGMSKCFAGWRPRRGANGGDVIRRVTDAQEREFERLGIDFKTLWGRPLQPIDCQNLFCEVSKYARLKHPDVLGVAGRTRIKQRYTRPAGPLDPPWYPPKWGLNARIASREHHSNRSEPAPGEQDVLFKIRPTTVVAVADTRRVRWT